MKKVLLFTAFLVAMTLSANAQETLIFEDDFESYDFNSEITNGDSDADGWYIVNPSTMGRKATIATDGANQYVKVDFPDDATNFTFGKIITLDVTKTYRFEIDTYASTDVQKYKIQARGIVPDSGNEPLGEEILATGTVEWTTSKIDITPNADYLESEFKVYIVKTKGDVYIDNFKIYEITSTGINDAKVNAFTVSPNPTSGSFKVSGAENLAAYVVYNTAGQVVKSAVVNRNEASVDLSGYPKGLYIVETTDKNGKAETHKVLIN